jgi:catechol 2,3-dioxygenase-like lactoylglutathione lyase family enzyme
VDENGWDWSKHVVDHIEVRASDFDDSVRFYATVLEPLGIPSRREDFESERVMCFMRLNVVDRQPPTTELHLCFVAASREQVDAFHRAGVEGGFRDDGAPGPRPQYVEDYYGGFLLDPDGNNAEAVHHRRSRGGGAIDHLWIRVADLAAAKRFYDAIAPFAALEAHTSRWGEQFRSEAGSFMLVDDGAPLTRNLHMAFAASDNATVDAFHAAAIAAGYRDNGGPGERAIYHPGYYGAFVLDPDGNNIEVVCHNR